MGDRHIRGCYEREEIFKEHESLIRSIAWKFYTSHKSYVLSFEDVYQTSCYLFLYALEIFDPKKGELTPHIKRTISYKLKAMLSGENAPRCSDYPFTFLRLNVYSLDAGE